MNFSSVHPPAILAIFFFPSAASMKFYHVLFAAMHFMVLMFPSTSLVRNNLTDLSALQAFKSRLTDPNNVMSTNWTADASFCTWIGVSCSRRRQRVVSLRLVNISLYGTIAPEVANMSFLSYLSLARNSLVGSIPDSLSHLPRLKTLKLGANQLSGSIPPAIFNMPLLTELYLDNNDLSGTIPTNHSLMLPLVQTLTLSSNRLTGNIPSELSRCHHLRGLSLSYNFFAGTIPMELGNLQELRLLYLGANNLTGTIPASLGNLTNLIKLDLSRNLMYGVIPEELGTLSKLQLLRINRNYDLRGHIPPSLSNMSSLTNLELSYNKFTGPIHLNFGNMPRLKILILGENKLSGGLDFLRSLSRCRDLQDIHLWGNELDGSLPSSIGNLSTSLLEFNVNTNHIKGKIPVELCNLTSLTTLDLGNNELVGTIPLEITNIESLQGLHLADNAIHGSIPSRLGRLRLLNDLFFHDNNLSGSIPESVGNISRLENLSLMFNALSSEIPRSLWNLTRLLQLDMSHNFLDGSLSARVGNIKFLDTFSVSTNRLSGEIPSSLKELQMLRYLDLSNNSFDGQIPPSLGELISIEVLNLSCNNLSGAIPYSLFSPRYLRSINLSFNMLEGTIPSNAVLMNLTSASFMGNLALCGGTPLGFPPCPANATVSDPSTIVHLLKYILPAVAFVIILFACFCILWKSRRKRARSPSPRITPSPHDYRMISYHELVRATENFNEVNLLGRGSFGTVYNGCLDDGLHVAVKVLNLEVEGASRSFDVECGALRMARHRNLVKIISTCSNLDFKALILQFMPNGSLERWLYSHNYCLNLLQRINVAIDVASALEYLHHAHTQVVLHCDLKPSNILLDEDMTAHVSDFGIAKLLVGDSRGLTSASLLGTIGYMAPEYASTGRVSRKSDVYSFGILLLEIFTRKKPSDAMFVGELSLWQWVSEAYPMSLCDVVDCNLLRDGDGNEAPSEAPSPTLACISSILELGIACSKQPPTERPAMEDVVLKLRKIKIDYSSTLLTARAHHQN